MDDKHLKQTLYLHGVPVIESDIPFIHEIVKTYHQAQTTLQFDLEEREEPPITIVDPEVITHD
ncbi:MULTISPECIES: hypothetical protein [Bacillaceae]|uniref:Uncharacterized protein n=1 Tax=Evansella alkalicola TaxID=745819 RepID=A0ABS6JYH7_9BACI|nr:MULTISPECIES: hypothetical protein [Bacillaceae]MBU9723543.1 hypothetical protein [Bacillus alkalicola]